MKNIKENPCIDAAPSASLFAAQGAKSLVSKVLVGLTLFISAAAGAQQGSSQAVRMVVGFAPGGTNDALARILAPKLSEDFGQQVLVDNRPGATGLIAAGRVAASAPDGTSLLLGSIGSQAMAPWLMKTTFDPVKDLLPLNMIGSSPMVLAVNPNVAAKTVAELVAHAKKNPGKLTYASSGNGSSLHLAGVLFGSNAGVELLHIPYKGNAPAFQALLAGEVDMIFSALSPVLPLAASNRVRMLGVASGARLASLPEVPTIAEAGVPGYQMSLWYGVFAAGATPTPIAERVEKAVRNALADPAIREQMAQQGVEPATAVSSLDFRRFVADEISKWGKVIKDTNIKLE